MPNEQPVNVDAVVDLPGPPIYLPSFRETMDWDGVHRCQIAELPVATLGTLSCESPDPEVLRETILRYRKHGFAVITLAEPVSVSSVRKLGSALGLGLPFVPPMYAGKNSSASYSDGVNIIAADAHGTGGSHPSFTGRDALRLHVDGTLQSIGEIRTSILACETPAFSGGEVVLFNSVAAFLWLADYDPLLAQALLGKDVLRRSASIPGTSGSVVGPAFLLSRSELLSRYSCSETDSWEGVDRRLAQAVSYMERASLPGGRFYKQFPLGAGEVLILANDKLAHGRTAYIDKVGGSRRLLRALYCAKPWLDGSDRCD